jgi:DNA-directed RNA polymerase subunit RPC12/RpoP
MIHFQCPNCLKKLKAPDETTGRKTNCPGCGQRLLIPPPIPTQVRNETILGQPTPSPPERLDESETGIRQPHQAEGEYSRLEWGETEPAERGATKNTATNVALSSEPKQRFVRGVASDSRGNSARIRL